VITMVEEARLYNQWLPIRGWWKVMTMMEEARPAGYVCELCSDVVCYTPSQNIGGIGATHGFS